MSESTTDQSAEPVADEPTAMDSATETDGTDALGDAGKKALDAMKGKWRDERDKRKQLEARIAEMESAASGTADQPDADAIRREATRAANARILKSEVRAAAVGKLANPALALKLLDLSAFEVTDSGDVDADEISDAIEDLLTREPYLAATARRFQGSGDGGAARKASGPTQLSRDELKGMKPEEIVKAKREGRLRNLLAGE